MVVPLLTNLGLTLFESKNVWPYHLHWEKKIQLIHLDFKYLFYFFYLYFGQTFLTHHVFGTCEVFPSFGFGIIYFKFKREIKIAFSINFWYIVCYHHNFLKKRIKKKITKYDTYAKFTHVGSYFVLYRCLKHILWI